MTILKCSAMTCVYNKEQLCSKGDIDVTGENATSANETSCGSFRERTDSSMKDSYTDGCGCDKIQIDCKAHNCTYNDNCKCTASSIQVDGSNAHASSEMCIRDRWYTRGQWKEHGQTGCFGGNRNLSGISYGSAGSADGSAAVSYTHLDVYKRQLLSIGKSGIESHWFYRRR